MSKRLHKEKPGEVEDRVVARSKPMMSLVSKSVNRSPTLDWSVSNRLGISECKVRVQIVPASGGRSREM